ACRADDGQGVLDMSQQRKQIGLALRYVVMCGLLVLFAGPFIWMASIALRERGNIYSLDLIPDNPTLANFKEVWNLSYFQPAFRNSVLVALMTVLSNIVLCSLAAHPLARMTFPGSRVVFILILSTLMV